jgi:hypothetical protein
VKVDEELRLRYVGLSTTSLMFVFEKGEDGLASGDVRVSGGETAR